MKFRSLRPSEVECRIGTIGKSGNGLSLLLYKTARTDMDILDETVGAECWQCEYEEHKGTLFCRIGICIIGSDGSERWVWKSNAGSPSNMEAQKGEASDAMKRAGFSWGIGRELYTAPFIRVRKEDCNLHQQGNKVTCYDRFKVTDMRVEEGKITYLQIVNLSTQRVVFEFGR